MDRDNERRELLRGVILLVVFTVLYGIGCSSVCMGFGMAFSVVLILETSQADPGCGTLRLLLAASIASMLYLMNVQSEKRMDALRDRYYEREEQTNERVDKIVDILDEAVSYCDENGIRCPPLDRLYPHSTGDERESPLRPTRPTQPTP